MPTSTFSITADDKPVMLDDNGTGQISITVSNTSNRSVRGQARIVPLGNTQSEWLKISGEVERQFSPDEAHQFVVRMTAPPGTSGGKYTFRLNVVSVENPDDDYAVGPTVAFKLPKSEPVPQSEGTSFPWFYVALGVIVIGGGITVGVLLSNKVEVPPLAGMELEEVTNKLEEVGLELAEAGSIQTGTNQPGIVAWQSPPAGEKLKSGGTVRVQVESEPEMVTVPDLSGTNVVGAIQRINELGLKLASEMVEVGTENSGQWLTVKETTPSANGQLRPGEEVTLTVWSKQSPSAGSGNDGGISISVEKFLKRAETIDQLKSRNLELQRESVNPVLKPRNFNNRKIQEK